MEKKHGYGKQPVIFQYANERYEMQYKGMRNTRDGMKGMRWYEGCIGLVPLLLSSHKKRAVVKVASEIIYLDLDLS